MTKPSDLPGFGTVDGDFVPTKSKLIVPKSVTKDSPLSELETPDQIKERPDMGADIELVPDTVVIGEELFIKPNGAELLEKHPDWEPNLAFQIKMFHRMIELAKAESGANAKRMDSLEILFEHYPLISGPADINEMRTLLLRNIEIQAEIHHYSELIQVRTEALNPKPRGFLKRLFKRK